MPMMRRGPLDRYTPEWVLRQANAHQVEGSIEFNTGTPVNPGNNTTVPGTPLSAGLLSSACQAVSGSTTLRDAYSYANSSAGSVLTTD